VAVTETFDPFDVEQGRRHQEAMAELRATCAVARLGSGMYVVSRCDDVKSMLTDPHMSNTDAPWRALVQPRSDLLAIASDSAGHIPVRDGLEEPPGDRSHRRPVPVLSPAR
jgi:hypothetical protein